MEELGYVSDEECHTRIDKGETVLQNRIFECFVQAVRVGVLEKATKDIASWKYRTCALHSDAFWFSKELGNTVGSDRGQRFSRWTRIPLASCVQLLRWPNDGRVFLMQTPSRSYYWRAKSQYEAEAWLVSIGCDKWMFPSCGPAQCAAVKETELLREAEDRLMEIERECADGCNAECVLRRSFDKWDVCENDANARLTVAREFYDVTEEKGIPAGGSQSGLTLAEVRHVIGLLVSLREDSDTGPKKCMHDKIQMLDRDQRIGDWLRDEVFPRFIASPMIQRRIAQLAASHGMVNWGIEPLRNSLLAQNMGSSSSRDNKT